MCFVFVLNRKNVFYKVNKERTQLFMYAIRLPRISFKHTRIKRSQLVLY